MSNIHQKSADFSKSASKPSTSNTMARSEIGAKWSKFTTDDLSGLKSKDDVISQVVSKYGMDKAQAQREVDALMKGRHFE
jgi:hypothetical protein